MRALFYLLDFFRNSIWGFKLFEKSAQNVFLFLIVCLNTFIFAEERPLPYSPVSFQGRFHPFEAYSRIWLHHFYHAEKLKKPKESAHEFLLHYYLKGHKPFSERPLFWIQYSAIKESLGLNPKQARFSINELNAALYHNQTTNLNFLKPILIDAYLKVTNAQSPLPASPKVKLSGLLAMIEVGIENNNLVVFSFPEDPLFHYLHPKMVLAEDFIATHKNLERFPLKYAKDSLILLTNLKQFETWGGALQDPNKTYIQFIKHLQQTGTDPKEISHQAEIRFPLKDRLQEASSLLKMLPFKDGNGDWISLHALKLKIYDPQTNTFKAISNFTLYSDTDYQNIRHAYFELIQAFKLDQDLETKIVQLGAALNTAYESIAGQEYLKTFTKSLAYPTKNQLKVEVLYFQFPLIEMGIVLYLIAGVLLFLYQKTKSRALLIFALFAIAYAFLIHTLILAARCYILERPPVSNMFETVIYVPWISVLAGVGIWAVFRNTFILVASIFSALTLLLLILLTNVDTGLENLQAVLDSQYWLTVHVLLVVGSYGLFILSGILGHIFLIKKTWSLKASKQLQVLGSSILQTMYLGIALLIPGTILGGVWAAESWGRFWDWDPKESWAFISCCIYLLWVHAYNFGKIHFTGLAFGSIIGLMAISFTWYGVNYILGTGLHSYGFGNGGEAYYYAFLLFEALFLLLIAFRAKITLKAKRKA